MTTLRRALTTVLLLLVYVLLVTPVGLAQRLMRDPLHRRPDRTARSYWVPS